MAWALAMRRDSVLLSTEVTINPLEPGFGGRFEGSRGMITVVTNKGAVWSNRIMVIYQQIN